MSSHSPHSTARAIMCACVVLTMGCQGEVTEEDLDLWTNNALGIQRLQEVVVDRQEQPMAVRVRALEVVVKKGLVWELRGLLDAVWLAQPKGENETEIAADDELIRKDRETLVAKFESVLNAHLEAKDEYEVNAKDALLVMQRYMSDEQVAALRTRIIEWAFKGISWESSDAEVEKAMKGRILSGQLVDLGEQGLEPAAILASRGLVIDRMLDYLANSPSAKAKPLLVKALRIYHGGTTAIDNGNGEPAINPKTGEQLRARNFPQAHHLKALFDTQLPEAAAYLLEIYQDKDNDQDILTAAFNWASKLVESPSVQENAEPVAAQILEVMKGNNAEDKWLGIINLVTLSGAKHLAPALERFAIEDLSPYTQTDEAPAKSLIDLCEDLADSDDQTKATAQEVFTGALSHAHKVVRAMAVSCLKSLHAFDAVPALRELAKANSEEALSLEEFLEEEITLSELAQNSVDGLKLIEGFEKKAKAGKLEEEQLEAKRTATIIEMTTRGQELRKAVNAHYESWLATQQEEEKPVGDSEAKKDDGANKSDDDKKGEAPK